MAQSDHLYYRKLRSDLTRWRIKLLNNAADAAHPSIAHISFMPHDLPASPAHKPPSLR
jgi:hypothetical protein